jgi:L-fuconolactonase
MRIDTHQHFWIYTERGYAWMTDSMEALRRDYLPTDLAPSLEASGITGTIAVQAQQSLEETEWLLQLTDHNPFLKGVVGWVDLCSPAVDEQIEMFAGHPLFRGVRHVVHDEPDDRFMVRDDFLRGLGRLKRFGLTYDLLLFPRHLPVACEVVRQFPEQPFVLDHIAKPFIKARQVEPWASDLRRLAQFENVFCKLSGMVTEADWLGSKPADFTPFIDIVLECFGTKRLMVGSDWPVCTLAGSYAQVMKLASDFISQLSNAEQADIWANNAATFYKIQI